MKTKILFLALLAAIAVAFVSCSKDDSDTASPIVGTWVANLTNGATETVTFTKKRTFRTVTTSGGASVKTEGVYTYNTYTGRLELTVDTNDDEYVYVATFTALISDNTMILISESGTRTQYTKK